MKNNYKIKSNNQIPSVKNIKSKKIKNTLNLEMELPILMETNESFSNLIKK